jgi:hypothetical protein
MYFKYIYLQKIYHQNLFRDKVRLFACTNLLYDDSPYDEIIHKIDQHLLSIYPKYNNKLLFKKTDIVNDFKLCDHDFNNAIFSITSFIKAKILYEKIKNIEKTIIKDIANNNYSEYEILLTKFD